MRSSIRTAFLAAPRRHQLLRGRLARPRATVLYGINNLAAPGGQVRAS